MELLEGVLVFTTLQSSSAVGNYLCDEFRNQLVAPHVYNELIGAPPPLLRPVALTAGSRQIQHGGVPGRSG